MSNPDKPLTPEPEMSHEQMMQSLFASMVVQQVNMALMFLGKMPHPESGETVKNLEMAQLFIDQLEMLEAKTKGNLSPEEQGLLKQSLTTCRMAFVEAVQEQPPAAEKESAPSAPSAPTAPGAGQSSPASGGTQPAPESDSHKKFTKKY